MTREEAIYRLKNMAWLYGSAEREQNIEAIDMAIEALSNIETDPDVETGLCDTCKYYETSHEEYPCSDCTFGNSYYVPADTVDVAHDIPEYCSWSQTYTNMIQSVMADTQTEERARLVAKETELAHVAAKLENAEKRLDSTKDCTKFLLWLLEEIMDEENWEMNAVADGELIARQLKKLGLLEVKDGYYVRTSLTYGLQEEEKESLIDKIKNWRKNHV